MTINRMSKTTLAIPTKFRNFRAGNVEVTGGNLSEDATYYYRTFRSSGTFTITGGALKVDVLVVAGGGGGGGGAYTGGAGGGAGGVLSLTSQNLNASSYTVTVGAGGAAAPNGSSAGVNGGNSVFTTATAIGGGAGCVFTISPANGTGIAGGSGGGGAGSTGSGGNRGTPFAGGAGTAGQGYNGGAGAGDGASWGSSGGGGGAGGPGGNGDGGGGYSSIGYGGVGGPGTNAYSSWLTPTGVGVSGYIAGGGGGSAASNSSGSAGAGGAGGGGNATLSAASGSGVSNTGSGGAGAGSSAGAGGSGVVIVRYPKTSITSTFADYEHVGTITLGANQTSVTFAGLPQQYKHLQLRMVGRTDRAGSSSADLYMRLNGDTAGNYTFHQLYSYNNAVASAATLNATGCFLGSFSGASAPTSAFGTMVIDLLDFGNTSKNKVVRGVNAQLGASATGGIIGLNTTVWNSQVAVTSLTVYCDQGNILPGTRFSLYGLRG